MDPAGDSEELRLFRQKWKNGLSKGISDGLESCTQRDRENSECQHTRKDNCLKNRFESFGEEMRQLTTDLEVQVEPLECLSENAGNSWKSHQTPEDKSISIANQNEIVLFSLPQPSQTGGQITSVTLKEGSFCTKSSKKSLVDQLIEDIDEITSIPFFDLSLPKEVGIQIFSHLELKDLCACAQVSKSWRILAEDELIWYRMGCKLGYVQDRDLVVVDRANWKATVQCSTLEERHLRRNWKERICRLSSLEFERGETSTTHSTKEISEKTPLIVNFVNAKKGPRVRNVKVQKNLALETLYF